MAGPAAAGDAGAKGSGALAGERVVSSLLRYGVLISLALVTLGAALLFATHSTGYGRGLELQGLLAWGARAGGWPQTVGDILSGALAGRPYALILMGLLLLIATPVLRVVVSAVLFFIEGDRTYVGITLFVLAVLALSFALGKVE